MLHPYRTIRRARPELPFEEARAFCRLIQKFHMHGTPVRAALHRQEEICCPACGGLQRDFDYHAGETTGHCHARDSRTGRRCESYFLVLVSATGIAAVLGLSVTQRKIISDRLRELRGVHRGSLPQHPDGAHNGEREQHQERPDEEHSR